MEPQHAPQHAGAENVAGEPEGNQGAERELERLDRRHAQRAALPELPERQPGVEQEGEEQDELRRRGAPEADEDGAAGFHRVERDKAQRVVGEMGGGVEQEDEAAPQPQPDEVGHAADAQMSSR